MAAQWSDELARVLIGGQIGAASFPLLARTRELGIIHLLVLSGSQVHFFSSVSRSFWAPLLKRLPGVDERAIRVFLGIFLILWVKSFEFPPPLTRALMFELMLLYSAGFRVLVFSPFLLLLQVVLFPSHLFEIGFYLSWVSFVLLLWIAERKISKFWSGVLLSILCTSILSVVFAKPWPSISGWCLLIVANLTLAAVAEKIWFPVLATLHFLIFFGQVFGIYEWNPERMLGVEFLSGLVYPFLLPFIR